MKMAEFVKEYLESGLKVRGGTVHKKEDMEKFIKADLEAVITNYPDKALEIRNALQK